MINDIEQVLQKIFEEGSLISGVISSPKTKAGKIKKITIRPVAIKGSTLYQMSEHFPQKVIHKNLSNEACRMAVDGLLATDFKQGIFHTKEHDYHILVGKKTTVLKKAPTKSSGLTVHNRPKHYLLEEGVPVKFLVELGIMSSTGKVYSDKRDKFKQINRFLEIVSDVLPALKEKKKIHILDFGCGKAYLTFALYYYLHHVMDYPVEVTGLDLKEDVVAYCQELAGQLGYSGLKFIVGDINTYQPKGKIDLMVTLHACDTATDAALEKAVRWEADVILSVPCCQHELFSQIECGVLHPLLQHGLLKERFSALVTDAARGKLLEMLGYSVKMIEFIDPEHTPKNLLIRAVRQERPVSREKLAAEYRQFKELLSIIPSLETRLTP